MFTRLGTFPGDPTDRTPEDLPGPDWDPDDEPEDDLTSRAL